MMGSILCRWGFNTLLHELTERKLQIYAMFGWWELYLGFAFARDKEGEILRFGGNSQFLSKILKCIQLQSLIGMRIRSSNQDLKFSSPFHLQMQIEDAIWQQDWEIDINNPTLMLKT